MESVLTVRIDSAVKQKALQVMKNQGLTPSQAVRKLFDYASAHNELPFKDVDKPSKKEIIERISAFDACHTKTPLTLSDEELRAGRLRERYEFNA